MSRQFSPIELNHLKKYGYSNLDLNSIGEKPVEYVTGHAEFYGSDYLVTPDCLIPRIESEKIINLGIDYLLPKKNDILKIADIGCGSGCLGISLAKKLLDNSIENFKIILSDKSDAALKIAEINSHRLIPGHENKFEFIRSDLLRNFPQAQFDLIISNLPYIPSARITSLDSSVKDYEPLTALDGGPTGTELINVLLTQISSFLKKDYLIILEIDSTHKLNFFKKLPDSDFKIIKDIYGRNRFLIIRPKQ